MKKKKLLFFGAFCVFFVGTGGQVPGPGPGPATQPTSPPPVATQPPTTAPVNVITDKPSTEQWVLGRSPDQKRGLLEWLVDNCAGVLGSTCTSGEPDHYPEYEGYDGWFNNFAHPELGAVDTPLLRKLPNAYEDGVFEPSGKDRPGPIELSDELMAGDIGTQSTAGKTALLVFFGQQVVEEILDAQGAACPPEYFNINVPEGHRYRDKPGHTVLPFLRGRYDMNTGLSPHVPREQLNEITPWMDGGLTYGTSKAWADVLRTFANGTLAEDGLLAYSHDGLFPEYNTIRLPLANPPPPANHSTWISRHETARVNRFFVLGNPRGNENPFLLTFGVLWFRWHNHLARYLRSQHPDWSSERVFNEARKWVIATHQHIVADEWLPRWLGEGLGEYEGYDDTADPQITHVFQSAAMRFGHTLVTAGVYLRNYSSEGCDPIPFQLVPNRNLNDGSSGHSAGVRTCNAFWRSQDPLIPHDIDRMLMGMSTQLTEREDNRIVEDLRGEVFGPLEFSRRDLMAINIQRGREHGLPDYNTARRIYELPEVDPDNFVDVTGTEVHLTDPGVIERMWNMYGNRTDNVDIWVGGLLETTDRPGQLFRKIILDQFDRIRKADRFWFENELNGLFTHEEVERIRQLTMYDIIMSVTQMEANDIQQDPFLAIGQGGSVDNSGVASSCLSHPNMTNSTCTRRRYDGGVEQTDIFTCFHFPPLGSEDARVESCTDAGKYDYFYGSYESFALTFLSGFLSILAVGQLMIFLAKRREKQLKEERKPASKKMVDSNKRGATMPAVEWVSKTDRRQVAVKLNLDNKMIEVRTQRGEMLRSIDLNNRASLDLLITSDGNHLVVKVEKEYDLVLKFDGPFLRDQFLKALEDFISETGATRQRVTIGLKAALEQVVTKQHRQKRLEMFFRVVFAQAFKISHNEEEMLRIDAKSAKEVVNTELTKTEFADALSIRSDSTFIQKMFNLVDKDQNGYISFREFLDMMVVFAKGSAEDKARLMFDMYDIDQSGKLSRKEFSEMIRSLLDLSNATIEQSQLGQVVDGMFQSAGLSSKEEITLDDFQRLFGKHRDALGYAQLNFSGTGVQMPQQATRKSLYSKARETVFSLYEPLDSVRDGLEPRMSTGTPGGVGGNDAIKVTTKGGSKEPEGRLFTLIRYIENNRLQIFWVVLYTLVLFGIFIERAYYYSIEREHVGLRRIAGYGVSVTRGAASAMMFTYSTLLVTMCRNLVTFLRETFLHRFVPFDSAINMHKYIAFWALFFSVVHSIGHGFNFYNISTQNPDDLTCLFRDFFHSTHELPKFHYWCWQTVTGFTGILLVIQVAIIYIFATQYARRHVFNWFWITHTSYPILYILTVLHGSGRLVQPPFFHYFFLGPVILFTLDRLVSVSRKKVEISVVRAELLPSDVTHLEFKRPPNFEYKSGQWMRIACVPLNSNEYHPFTISSAPHEENLSLHIRAVGPWTRNLRRTYDPTVVRDHPLPKIHLDGPYGEGHQDWYRFEVAVLVGGGIGVTPFASILKDIVFKSTVGARFTCRKVYFLWVTRTQKHFEWLVDIIRDVEDKDKHRLVSTHIFITQFYQKFDLRTTMLYICERHFQKISQRSLFTGLRSITHFGRPDLQNFFRSLKSAHPQVQKFGVFSCGPPPMTRSVEDAAQAMNKEDGAPFQHHFENF